MGVRLSWWVCRPLYHAKDLALCMSSGAVSAKANKMAGFYLLGLPGYQCVKTSYSSDYWSNSHNRNTLPVHVGHIKWGERWVNLGFLNG